MQNPKISIVVPTYGRTELLKDLISSVRTSTPQDNYEFVVVASDLPEADKIKWLSQQGDVKLILTGQRKKWELRKQSLYYFTNLGIKKAKNEWVFVVNDDMFFDQNWYKEFEMLVSNPTSSNVGMIIVATHIGSTSLGARVATIGKTKKDDGWKDLYLSDLSIIKKEVLEEIGYFDENLKWYGSGADNSLAVEFLTNKETLVAEKIIVNHLIAKENRNSLTEDAFTDFHYISDKWNVWCEKNGYQYVCDFLIDPYTLKNKFKHDLIKRVRILQHHVKSLLFG